MAAGVSAADLVEQQRALARARTAREAALQRSAVLEQQANSAKDVEDGARARTAAIAARIQAAEADVSAANARIAVIETLRRRQRARLAQKQQPAVRLIAALQLIGRRPAALAFVQPGSMRDIVHIRAVFGAMLPAIEARTADLRAEVARGVQLRAQADVALGALKAGRTALLARQNELAADAAAATAHRSALAAGALVEQDRAIAMGEKARDISALMSAIRDEADVRDQLADLPGPVLRPAQLANLSSALPLPATAPALPPMLNYRLPVIGEVITGLGEETTPGVRSRGLTISTQPNAVVVAPSAGRVAFAGVYRGFGQIIIIDHGHGLTTLITSLARLEAHVGDTVIQGSPLGRAGADQPTVTVELRRGGSPVDITPLVS
jgi:septal ring factor EnvC (AmiA/AmiB activator)